MPPSGSPTKMLSVLEVVRSSTDYLQKHGVESARLNAECLVAHVLGKKQRIDLYLEFDRPLGARELDPLRDLMRRRGKGEPLQHLLGTVEFHGREFAIDARALIPRPETEEFVARLLGLEMPAGARCVDVGVGSGVIALTLAAQWPAAEVIGVDASTSALALAAENAARLGLGRVTLQPSDLLAEVAGPFHLVAANLPYVASEEIAGLAREVRCDPIMALDGGPDGLALIRRCIREAKVKLRSGGCIGLEVGHDQAPRVRELLEEAGFRDVAVLDDHQGVARFLLGTRAVV